MLPTIGDGSGKPKEVWARPRRGRGFTVAKPVSVSLNPVRWRTCAVNTVCGILWISEGETISSTSRVVPARKRVRLWRKFFAFAPGLKRQKEAELLTSKEAFATGLPPNTAELRFRWNITNTAKKPIRPLKNRRWLQLLCKGLFVQVL